MPLSGDARTILEETSRTFFLPISLMPPGLQEAIASAYLCLRAIDEIEDHPVLAPETKTTLLCSISQTLQTTFCPDDFACIFSPHASMLPDVTLRLAEWIMLAPPLIAPRIWDATATMAERMACWVQRRWRIDTEADLDAYTFSVAGSVGLIMCDLCAWHDGGQADRGTAIACGRGLQAVNILRNRDDDLRRGVDFFPRGWDREAVARYAHAHLAHVQEYLPTLPSCSIHAVCGIPVALALATLDALAGGASKLSREAVLDIVARVGT